MTTLLTLIVAAECMLWFTVFGTEIIDPCDTTTRLRFMPYRSSQIPLTPDPDQFSICDQRLDYREGWWYLPADESVNLYDITTQCPGLLTCSSMYPIYYNGLRYSAMRHITTKGLGAREPLSRSVSHSTFSPATTKTCRIFHFRFEGGHLINCSERGSIPRVEDGVVETRACQLGNDGCGVCTVVGIKIKNCGRYRVYFLPRASGCLHAYCFEPTNSTLISTTGKTTSVASTVTTRTTPKETTELLNTSPTTTITTAKTTEKGAKPDTTTIPPDTGNQLSTAVLAAIVASSFLFFAGTVILCVLFICRWRKREDPPMYEEAVKDKPTHIYDVITNTTNVKYGPFGIDNMGYETNGSLGIYDEIPEKTDKPHIEQNEGVGNPGYLHAILANNASDGSRNVPQTQFVNMESSVERQSSEYDEAFMNENALNEERLSKEETTS